MSTEALKIVQREFAEALRMKLGARQCIKFCYDEVEALGNRIVDRIEKECVEVPEPDEEMEELSGELATQLRKMVK